jgi:hypothetical protein
VVAFERIVESLARTVRFLTEGVDDPSPFPVFAGWKALAIGIAERELDRARGR